MAIWQCHFYIRPKQAIEVQGSLPVAFSGTEQAELESLWAGNYSLVDLPAALAELLPERRSWSDCTRSWGDEEGDRVDLSGDDGKLEEWRVRFDLRYPNYSFIRATVDLAKRFNGVFISSRNYVIPPSYTKLMDQIRRDASFRFVENPGKFFEEVAARIENNSPDRDVND